RAAGQLALTDDVAILTPDDMVCAGRLLAAGPDIAAVRFSAARRPPPPGIALEATYRFGRAPSAAREAAWLAAATAEADAEFAGRHPGVAAPAGGTLVHISGGLLPAAGLAAGAAGPLVAGPAGGAALPAAGAVVAAGPPPSGARAAAIVAPAAALVAPPPPPVAAAAAAPIAAGPSPPSALRWARPGRTTAGPPSAFAGEALQGWAWVVAEDVGTFSFGTVVQAAPMSGVVPSAHCGRRVVVILAGGIGGMSFLLEEWRRADFVNRWRGSGARMLARMPGPTAPRSWLSAMEVAKEIADPGFTFVLRRSTAWCVSWLFVRVDQSSIMRRGSLASVAPPTSAFSRTVSARRREQDSSQRKLPMEELAAFVGGAGAASQPGSMMCPVLFDVVGMGLERVGRLEESARKLRGEEKAACRAKDLDGRLGGAGAERPRDIRPPPAPAAADSGGGAGGLPGASTARRRCLGRIADSVLRLGPSLGDLQSLPAPWELRATLPCDGSLSTGAEAIDVLQLSLPPTGNAPARLGRSLGPEDFLRVLRDERGHARPLALRGFVGEAARRRGHRPGALLGVIDGVGLFSAPKKSGAQRLVVGSGHSEFWLGALAGVHLAAGAALAAVEFPGGADPWAVSADVADASLDVELPLAWRPRAALPPIDEWRLGRSAGRGRRRPRARVVGRQICPNLLVGSRFEYVDEIAALSPGAASAQQSEGATQASSCGRVVSPVREELAALQAAQLLGRGIDSGGGAAAPVPRQAPRLTLAARALFATPKVSAQQVGQVVGRGAFLFMAGRPLLSVFSAVYRFVAQVNEAPRAWWPGVGRELTRAMGVAPLALDRGRVDQMFERNLHRHEISLGNLIRLHELQRNPQ
ncbi:unnamed protein product, partial [Prorocentrum cordatum]